MKSQFLLLLLLGVLCCATWKVSAITIPSDGSDGALAPSANLTIDLSKAVTGTWSQAGTGTGVYDPTQWAVVFKYSFVNISPNVTVTFINNATNAPVIWLVQGAVTIAGTVQLSGNTPVGIGTCGVPGPGGFRGGFASSGGFGPGGGNWNLSSTGSYGTLGYYATDLNMLYGNANIIPLVGGSGCSGNWNGGAGGGAILIATPATIQLGGAITANGGGGGSGGAVRLICNQLLGTGTISAVSSWGAIGNGRIDIETNNVALLNTNDFSPLPNIATVAATPQIWPLSTQPTVTIVSVGSATAGTDPRASLVYPNEDLFPTPATTYAVKIAATNVPLTWNVYVRVVPVNGADFTVGAVAQTGSTGIASTWIAQIDYTNLDSDFVIQVHALPFNSSTMGSSKRKSQTISDKPVKTPGK